ncbi:hypothetical protein ACIODS_16100 [Micromonospora chalcea]|uniref:hypothetical protein n=1 Tax=Micromonospora chalcea TaxID=1874 RepID=UPI0037F22B23
MRTVFVFPALAQAAVVALLDRLSPAVRALSRARGGRPSWAVHVDVSGRVDGTAEVRRLTSVLLGQGGVAMDDYSDHVWTAEQIAADVTVDGLRFFDFRGHYERNRLAR